jgi:hypothetical protein
MAIFWVCGCARNTEQRYVPAVSDAREAVETVLDSWKSGEKHNTIKSSKVKIDLFDARRHAGKKLESYTIVDEIAGQTPRQFKVQLKIAGQKEQMSTYMVIGSDPLSVFRDVDYKAATGQEK